MELFDPKISATKTLTQQLEASIAALLDATSDAPSPLIATLPTQDLDPTLAALNAAIQHIHQNIRTMKEAHRQQENRLKDMLNLSAAVVYTCEVEPPYKGTYISDNVFSLLGYHAHELIDNPSFWTQNIHPDDRQRVLDGLSQYLPNLQEGEEYVHEYRFRAWSGHDCWMRDILKIRKDPYSHRLEIVGSWTDITAQRRAEEEAELRIHRSSALLRTLVSSAPIILFATDKDGLFTMLEGRDLRTLGLKTELLLGTSSLKIFGKTPGFSESLRKANAGKTAHMTLPFKSSVFETYYAPNLDPSGHICGTICIGFDITEWRTIQRTLSKTEQRLTEVLRLAHIGVWELDLNSQQLWWSDESYLIHGFDLQLPITQDRFLQSIHPDDRPGFQEAFACIMSNARTGYDFRIIRPTGEVRHISSRAWIVFNEFGEPKMLAGINHDITDQRRADLHIREQARLLNQIFDHTLDSLIILDPNFNMIRISHSATRSCNNPPDSLIGQNYFSFGPPHLQEAFEYARQHKTTFSLSALPFSSSNHPERTTTFWNLSLVPLTDDKNNLELFLLSLKDVTTQVLADKQISSQLLEKETLLREIHHRVKNNLQIISSLLYFQAKKTPEHALAFIELRERLFAMTLVHEKLYQSKQLSQLSLRDYVQGLVLMLVNSIDGRQNIPVHVSADDTQLPIELALPCGMILCELLTNVFKYAFPPPLTGSASVHISRAASLITIKVLDNGVGLPPGFDLQSSGSFGWELVRTLVAQLHGHIEATNLPGAHIHVHFPIPTHER